MDRINRIAEIVGYDLGKFPGRIAEIISAFKAFTEGGWGKGFSGRHLTKIIARDETAFTTTWAELRKEQMGLTKELLGDRLENVKVPLPSNRDGKVLTDKEIHDKVNEGYKLFFCPITNMKQMEDSSIFPFDSIESIGTWINRKDWKEEIEYNLRPTMRPYWFWLDCKEKGTRCYSPLGAEHSPTLLEYLIAKRIFKEETGKSLDNDCLIWLNHHAKKETFMNTAVTFGGNPIRRVLKSQIVDFERAFQNKAMDLNMTITARHIEIL
jgi:hypothetical protein